MKTLTLTIILILIIGCKVDDQKVKDITDILNPTPTNETPINNIENENTIDPNITEEEEEEIAEPAISVLIDHWVRTEEPQYDDYNCRWIFPSRNTTIDFNEDLVRTYKHILSEPFVTQTYIVNQNTEEEMFALEYCPIDNIDCIPQGFYDRSYGIGPRFTYEISYIESQHTKLLSEFYYIPLDHPLAASCDFVSHPFNNNLVEQAAELWGFEGCIAQLTYYYALFFN